MRLAKLGVAVAVLTVFGCGGLEAGTTADAGTVIVPSGGDGGPDAHGITDARPGMIDALPGAADARESDAAACATGGAACAGGGECCSQICTGGHCGFAGCAADGDVCFASGDCCSGDCAGAVCVPVVGATCTTLGNPCTSGGGCCSQTCTGDICVNAAGPGGCVATGDICYSGEECCSGQCNSLVAGVAGTCAKLQSSGSGGCSVDGEPCTSGTNCCSRLCAPIPGGGDVCQVASGCRLIGDLCHADSDCCGGAGSGTLGAGEATCTIVAGTSPPIGTCSNPTGCDPEGDVCGNGVNARQDCCGCAPPKIDCCKPDHAGVERCYGTPATGNCPDGYTGMAGCCVAAGQICAFSGECCDGVPCLPDGTGVLRCGTSACVPTSSACTSTADCCSGLACTISPGALTGTCGVPVVPPLDAGLPHDASSIDGGVTTPDASTIDAPLCALVGQSCGDSEVCCNGLLCGNGAGNAPCAQGETDCRCAGIP